ncbi:pre-toxin TG domain-containing protein [Streptomyces sp. NPDC017056]|uniref:pre-toxin TG domain-containing protein n=1 Tax=Streptomyces sp. NPDC017056 TaxID=3364973 RepID=UPI0037A55689
MIQAMDQMVRGLNEMIVALDGMNQALDQMNRGINGMVEGIDQANRGIAGMNRGIAEANRGMEQANQGVAGMNKAIGDINDAIKTPIAKDGSSPFKDLDLSGIGDYVRGHSKVEDSKAKQALTSLVANLLPGAGDAKGVTEAITGTDIITGEKLPVADRILGAVILTRWIKAGKDIIKAEDLIKSIKAEKATGKIDGWLSRQAWDKVPGHLKSFEKSTNKGVGYRWNNGKGDGVRIDKGNPNNSQVIQQVDHVVINSGGKVIGRDGKPISGSIKDNPDDAHIPLSEWVKWREWNKP